MQSIGERLEEARKRKGITIREASEATKIRGDYLNSFENNNFSINLPDIYTRGFLRTYSNYLKLNADKILTDYNAILLGEGKPGKRDHRELFGRMELQKPIIQEEPSDADTVDDEKMREQDMGPSPSVRGTLSEWWNNLDKEIAIKIGISGILALLVIAVITSVVMYFINPDQPADDDTLLSNTNQAATQAESVPMTLVAKGDVRVTVTPENSNRPLYANYPMTTGDELPLDVMGRLTVEWDRSENLAIRIGGEEYSMPATRNMGKINPAGGP